MSFVQRFVSAVNSKVEVIHDPGGKTLTIWFGNPAIEQMSVPEGDDTKDYCLLMVGSEGKVLGFEITNFRPWGTSLGLAVESVILQVEPNCAILSTLGEWKGDQ